MGVVMISDDTSWAKSVVIFFFKWQAPPDIAGFALISLKSRRDWLLYKTSGAVKGFPQKGQK